MTIEWCIHRVLGVIIEHPASGPCPSHEELIRDAEFFLEWVEYQQYRIKEPGDEGYETWLAYQKELEDLKC